MHLKLIILILHFALIARFCLQPHIRVHLVIDGSSVRLMSVLLPQLCLPALEILGVVDGHEEERVVVFDHLAYLVEAQSIVGELVDEMALEENLALMDVRIWYFLRIHL